jgi:hypothetical protein
MGREALKVDRNTSIYRLRQSGAKYSAIARQFDITRQRAHQVVEAVRDRVLFDQVRMEMEGRP